MLTAVVVACNHEFQLKQTLLSLIHPSIGQVVLVDDASTDDTVNYVRRNFPNVHLIINHTFLGKAKSLNRAFMVSENDTILLIDPGMQLIHLPTQFSSQNFELYLPYCFTKKNDNQEKILPILVPYFEFGELIVNKKYLPTLNDEKNSWPYIDNVLLCHKSLWDLLNGFSDLYFPFGFEILDFVYRAKKQGAKVIVFKECCIEKKIPAPYAEGFYTNIQLRMIDLKNHEVFLWHTLTSYKFILILIMRYLISLIFFRFSKIRVLCLSLRFLPKVIMAIQYRKKEKITDEIVLNKESKRV